MLGYPKLFGAPVAIAAIVTAVTSLMQPLAAQEGPLMVGADVGANPYIIANPDGTITGFNIDLVEEVARRLGRSGVDVVDQQFSGIFAGLEAQKYEFIAAPVTLTQERSEQMLFIEGFIATDFQFLTEADGPQIEQLEGLQGLQVAVNNGSAQAQWLLANQEKYGFEIQNYGKNADAFQAVLAGRADVAISGDGNVMYAAAQNPALKASYRVSTGNVFSWAFRQEDEEMRTRVERVMECMKLDGTVAKIYQEWFGGEPEPGTPPVTVYAGVGQPGVGGFVFDFAAPECGS